ncbi:uncharacterized protein C20orf96 homolog isoform X1 [Ambystoma mexicanum]|uniref:uncharacterized protein C20orf96 homolog isoform X1 n=1 Tax=Ambystoma mexicanum TaxID=8296 RepID=UPI0037E7FCDC
MADLEAANRLLKKVYSPSQRTKEKDPESLSRKSLRPPIANNAVPCSFLQESGNHNASRSGATFTVGAQPSPSQRQAKLKSSSKNKAASNPKDIRIVQNMVIRARKLAVAELKMRCKVLEEANVGLMKTIENLDATSAAEASALLHQYDRSGGNIASVQLWSQRQVNEARDNLQNSKDMAAKRLSELEKQLLALNAKLQAFQNEVHTLRTYRDKEYPVQVLRIAELQRQVRKLQEAHQDEKEDIEALADTEMEKLSAMAQHVKVQIMEKISKAAVCGYPPVLRQMSLHNTAMTKEVQEHKEAIKELETDIATLKETHAKLLASHKERRLVIFPEVLLQRPKCHPDAEIILDIALERPIPI